MLHNIRISRCLCFTTFYILEKIKRNFLWEGVEEGGGAYLVSWGMVSKSLEAVGLGIGNLRLRNDALSAALEVFP